MSSAVLLPASFAILLAAALLFTNAIEWFGSMVGLGQGAVGSCLALGGGLVAILTLQIRRRFSGRAIALWAALYAAFVVYVVSTA